MQVRPMEGRKHQVRAHVFSLGTPMLLDPIYSDAGGTFVPVNQIK
jgi:23S rRNA-/tRNA-specific pseudouridylate synthase